MAWYNPFSWGRKRTKEDIERAKNIEYEIFHLKNIKYSFSNEANVENISMNTALAIFKRHLEKIELAIRESERKNVPEITQRLKVIRDTIQSALYAARDYRLQRNYTYYLDSVYPKNVKQIETSIDDAIKIAREILGKI